MQKSQKHKPYCFAGEPAPCPGYFENDVLPCTCGATQPILDALSAVAFPAVPIEQPQARQAERALALTA
jgi:hypothetical protein